VPAPADDRQRAECGDAEQDHRQEQQQEREVRLAERVELAGTDLPGQVRDHGAVGSTPEPR
jgi:hypothetical protein